MTMALPCHWKSRFIALAVIALPLTISPGKRPRLAAMSRWRRSRRRPIIGPGYGRRPRVNSKTPPDFPEQGELRQPFNDQPFECRLVPKPGLGSGLAKPDHAALFGVLQRRF